jgi:nitrite reductase/ring-hydroxylating ferredoxin subunit
MSWLTDTLASGMAAQGLTVDAAARQLAIERSRLANILSGSAVPNESLTRRMAKLLGEDPQAWLGHVERPAGERAAAGGPPASPPVGYVRVAKLAEVPEGAMKVVWDGLAVVTRVEGQLHAFANACPHAGGALGEGLLKGCVVKCPWHAGRWDVRTGKALTLLDTTPIPVFEVRADGDDIEIRFSGETLAAPALAPPELQKTPG